jgi:nitroimidazol reductase NimA-like FMN-containing flavoprotein (pyridoxamine 5'-phosphate oxidase superfamily)
MNYFEKENRNRLRRLPERGHYDTETIYQIIDEALLCHVGFVQEGRPYVIPTIHARERDRLYLHGAKASRLLKVVQAGEQLCITITLLDGLVLARSVFHHSMNYRSAVLFGHGRLVDEEGEKLHGLKVISEHIMPGRWDDARRPTAKELKATSLVAVSIDSASAKVRTGPPEDDEEDYGLPIWAGLLPIRQSVMDPLADPRMEMDVPLPGYLKSYRRK